MHTAMAVLAFMRRLLVGRPLRSPALVGLTLWLVTFLLIWFVVLLVIHFAVQATSDNQFIVQLTLAEQSLQLFTYSCLLCLASASACWNADFARTKGSRSVASVVCTLMKSAWLFELWFIIPSFHSDASNWYCNDAYFGSAASSASIFCRSARASATCALAVGLGVFLLFMWTLVCRLQRRTPDVPIPTSTQLLPAYNAHDSNQYNAAHNVDINWRTVLTHPEDLEQSAIASTFPALHSRVRKAINILGRTGTVCVSMACFGVLLITYPSIQFSDTTGFSAWLTSADIVSTNGNYQSQHTSSLPPPIARAPLHAAASSSCDAPLRPPSRSAVLCCVGL